MMSHKEFHKEVAARHRALRQMIGANVRGIRTRRDMTIRKLARLAQLSPETIDHLELGRGEIDLLQIARISAALNVGCGEILYQEKDERILS